MTDNNNISLKLINYSSKMPINYKREKNPKNKIVMISKKTISRILKIKMNKIS